MAVNQVNSVNRFYIRASMCYGNSHCNEVEVPWVRDLALLPKLADIVVLDGTSGKWPPGLYVRYHRQNWRMALNFEDVCNLLVTASEVRVVVNATTDEALADGWVLFKNAVPVTGTAPHILPSAWDIWVGVLSETAFMSGAVTKQVDSPSSGIIQVSSGTDKSIKDWTPPGPGLVLTDVNGKASVAALDTQVIQGNGVDIPFTVAASTDTAKGIVSLATAGNYPAPSNDTDATTPGYVNAAISDAIDQVTVEHSALAGGAVDALAVDAADPKISLVYNGTPTNALPVKALRSLSGAHLGHVVTGSIS